ncbi:hypothetical protein QN277_007924 [Acacia crassicarpa]|uniref:Uncharacterized protein n=1 Tax=Acacia crassicarpa TaxID=499986 RepID=A0AAE1JKK9_9FABA|nr:hypothetical protein QN277_007924 [Acacia crassicarpa]
MNPICPWNSNQVPFEPLSFVAEMTLLLIMFYQINISSTGPMPPLDGLKSPPSHAFFMKKKELKFTKVNHALKRPESLKEVSLEIPENVDGKNFACPDESSMSFEIHFQL